MGIPENWVRMARCMLCGRNTDAILLHRRLKSIPENLAWNPEPCSACKERLKFMVYFAGDCGHSGFVKVEVVERLIKPDELRETVRRKRICRMAKCFVCLTGQNIADFESIGAERHP
jgi:hypothetical protein